MTANTKIEWADHTFNPWTGCQAISPGCVNCYAESWAKRAGRDFAERRRTKTWGDPRRWNEAHAEFFAKHGRRQRVFCASLADVFDNAVDPAWRAELFELIKATPNLDWLLLTKRIGNAAGMIADAIRALDIGHTPAYTLWPWPNVWIGATMVNQEEVDRDIMKLIETPAAKRFLSIEPMLGPITFADAWIEAAYPVHMRPIEKIDWVIVGGESGHDARPMHPGWARTLRDECQAVGVAFFFKQWGEWRPATLMDSEHDPLMRWIREDGGTVKDILDFPDHTSPEWMKRVGKKKAGRLLDGREYSQVPA